MSTAKGFGDADDSAAGSVAFALANYRRFRALYVCCNIRLGSLLMGDEFDQAQYWLDRHKRLEGDPRSVGHLGRSVERNKRSEQVVASAVSRAAKLLRPRKTVIDVGCGYGRVSRSFTENGYDYLGVDVSPVAVRQAKENNPNADFLICDLSNWSTSRTFDVVSVLYVFVHFVDDVAWNSIVDRCLQWVAPEGVLLFADNFPEQRVDNRHFVGRPLAEYERIFNRVGFFVDDAFVDALKDGDTVGAEHFRLARRIR